MAVVFTLFHFTRKRIGESIGYFILVFYWLSYEYFYLDWDLTWPWLMLGNGFAGYYKWIQWYEFTGVHGGSLWILVLNILIYLLLKKVFFLKESLKENLFLTVSISLLLIVPIFGSLYMYQNYKEEVSPVKIAVVQPNVDPYNEKFSGNFEEQLKEMLKLAKSKIDTSTEYLVFPETALTENIWENGLENSFSIVYLRGFLKEYPRLKIVIGATSLKLFANGETLSETARKFTSQEGYHDVYNTALQVDNTEKIQIYHKSKLVPGVEKMPFPSLMKPLENLALDLGGTMGSLGSQKERSVFNYPPYPSTGKSLASCVKIAPVVCYESVYGEYVSEYVKNGANLIFIITNDGWWADTPGYKQHLHYASLRAIEARRSIARSANTGVSCFINQRGDILQATPWWSKAIIESSMNSNSKLTFYTLYGDYIARFCAVCSLIVAFYALFNSISKNRKFVRY